jgi:transcriptional regulator with XRE-family HTH domain
MNRIREWRRRKGLSMAELARLTRTTASQISKIERGERRLTVEWLGRLAPALGCRRQDLLPLESEGEAAAAQRPPVDRELLRRMMRVLESHLKEERLDLPAERMLDSALVLHDFAFLRTIGGEPEDLPPDMKPVLRLISGN